MSWRPEQPPTDLAADREGSYRVDTAAAAQESAAQMEIQNDGGVHDPLYRVLQSELEHRYRNALTLAACIMRGSLREYDCVERGLADAERRLTCLASANARLMDRSRCASRMEEVCAEASRPFTIQDKPFAAAGPDIRVPEDIALSLSLTIHELATNSLKYGALQSADGRVEIRWRWEDHIQSGSGLRFAWIEYGSSSSPPPTKPGFGTKLIDAVLARHIRGDVSRSFLPSSFRCSFVIDLPTADDGDQMGLGHDHPVTDHPPGREPQRWPTKRGSE